MLNLLRIELSKAVRSKFFIFSTVLGCTFAALSAGYIYMNYSSDAGVAETIRRMEETGASYHIIMEANTLYGSWIGAESGSLGYTLFFTLLPILAALPCGFAFSDELNSGYLKSVVPRCGRQKYFTSKLVSAFIAGGVTVAISLIFNLLLMSLFLAAISPNIIYGFYGFAIQHGDMLSTIAYSHPLLFTAIYICIDFVFSGLFACLSLSAAFFFKHRAASVIVPFLLITFCDMARTLLYYISTIQISPLKILHTIPIDNITKPIIAVAWFVIFCMLTVPLILIKGQRREII
jgi:hypothetical protein